MLEVRKAGIEAIGLRNGIERSATDRSLVMGPRSRADLTIRHRRRELMDDPALDVAEHIRALQGLARINRLSRSDAILWPAIAELVRDARETPLRVLDLASGGGDVVLALAARAAAVRLNIEFEGSDVSADAVRFATAKAAERRTATHFEVLDVLNEPIPDGYDIVMCSLFLHHLEDEQAVTVLSKMAVAARRRVLVNDLIRSRAGYLLAWAGCHLLSRSPIVRYDGPVSVAGAYTIAEISSLADRAGLEGVRLSRHWPCRFLLSWSRRS